jgi:CRISPR/Cas system CMR-associated protein Cmr3 (group 5 of RAMP superfamily)
MITFLYKIPEVNNYISQKTKIKNKVKIQIAIPTPAIEIN